jgi:DNA-binding CsgD family transcriptional regulator/tetratricopeptide (TPR) repeat protein
VLLGREAEKGCVAALLAGVEAGRGGGLIIRGEAGIGKTALLEWALAEFPQCLHLRARGFEGETGLSFAGVRSLLEPVIDEVRELPEHQGAALLAALGVGPPVAADRFAVYSATLNLLAVAARRRPVLAVVDDAHWMDPASIDALLFAARRLAHIPIAALFAIRDGETRMFDDKGIPALVVSRLDEVAARALLEACAGDMSPSVERSLIAATAGNPLALMELGPSLSEAQRAGREPIDESLPVGTLLERIYNHQVARLPEQTQRALLVVAAANQDEDLPAIRGALRGLGLDADMLIPAEAAGLVAIGREGQTFRHPLVRAAVYRGAPAHDRREAHAALAEALAVEHTQARRAWHLAAASAGPDEHVARELERAAHDAQGRAALAEAIAAFTAAARISPSPRARANRLLLAARAAILAGRFAEARELLDDAHAIADEPLLVADIDAERGTIELARGSPWTGHELLVGAADSVESSHPERAAEMLCQATAALMAVGTTAGLVRTAERARRLARSDGATAMLATLLLGEGLAAIGDARGTELLAQLEPVLLAVDPLAGPHELQSMAALCWVWTEDYAHAERVLNHVLTAARRANALHFLPLALAVRSWLDLRRGSWALGHTRAAEALRLAEETGQVVAILSVSLAVLAMFEAPRGNELGARRHLDQAEAINGEHQLNQLMYHAHATRGLLELGLGRADRALEALELAWEAAKVMARSDAGEVLGDPGLYLFAPDFVEACIRTRQEGNAVDVLDWYAARADATDRAGARAAVARLRGLLADDAAFEGFFEDALGWHGRVVNRFEEARTRLCFAERLRRARRRVDARHHLHVALTSFEQLGAVPWAERARVELRASDEGRGRGGGPAPDPHAPRAAVTDELTPQELQIATLVVDGATNKEVAGALFLSPKTVEFHLRNIFRKLDVSSRVQLTRLLAVEYAPQPVDGGLPERTLGQAL